MKRKVNMVAGSGKTTTLLNIMKDNYKEKNILFLTFSKVAITDLENKLSKFGIPKGAITFSTIDALASRTLSQKFYFDRMGAYDQAIPAVSDKTGMKWADVNTFSTMYINELFDRIEDDLSIPKNKQSIYWDYFVEIYENYNRYSFNYIMYKFKEKIDLFKSYLTYDLIMIDEAQDLSNIQIDVIRKIIEFNPSGDVHIVGDILQNIYGFRHAGASLLMESLGDDEVVETKGLTYRCPEMITKKANNIIDAYFENFPIDKRFKVKLKPYKEDFKGEYLFFEEKTDIKQFLPQKIDLTMKNNKTLGVLVRNNYQLMDLVSLIPEQYQKDVYIKERNVFTGMPVLLFNQIIGLKKKINKNAYTKKDVSSLLLTSGIFGYKQQHDFYELLVEKGLNNIKDYKWKSVVSVLKSYQFNNFKNFKKEYISYLRGLKNYNKTIDNNEAFITFLDRVDSEEGYRKRIESISRMQNNMKGKSIILMTIHASKGLEYDDVIMYGMNYKVIDEEGEYKLLYVGVTRAKENLYQFGSNHISRLISEA